MFNNIIKNNSVLENKKSKTLLYTIATLVTITLCSGSNEVYAMNIPALNNQVQNVRMKRIRADKFTPEEDKLIIEKYGELGRQWEQISRFLFGRYGCQVEKRYKNCLDPNINKNPWTPEEDELIIDKQKELGNNWAKMTAFFIGRTPNSLRSRYISIQNRLNKPNKLDKFHSRKPEQLIQQPDQIATTLPVQEINSDTDVEGIFVQSTVCDSNQSISLKPNVSSLMFPDLSFLSDISFNTTNIIYLNK